MARVMCPICAGCGEFETTNPQIDWLDPESAPKDGSYIVIVGETFAGRRHAQVARWVECRERWSYGADNYAHHKVVIGWYPIPVINAKVK